MDIKPVFLNTQQVEKLHERSLIEHGGSAGLRDRALFAGTVGQAQNVYYSFLLKMKSSKAPILTWDSRGWRSVLRRLIL